MSAQTGGADVEYQLLGTLRQEDGRFKSSLGLSPNKKIEGAGEMDMQLKAPGTRGRRREATPSGSPLTSA